PLQRHTCTVQLPLPYNGKLAQIIPPAVDDRVAAQKSVFTIQTFGSVEKFIPLDERELRTSIDEEGTNSLDEAALFGKVVIPQEKKSEVLQQLMSIGIDASLVFPGLQG